jgi:hypothetical protein
MAKRTLEDFFEALRTNQRANQKIYPESYAIIARIDACFVRAGENLINPKPEIAGILLLRCQHAFKAAAAMALAGQAADVFPVLRSVLEYAGYCLLIAETPSLESVFILRHADEAAMKEQRDAFQIKAVKGAVSRHCTAALTTLYDDLYQRTIDFGAHPNPHAVLSVTSTDVNERQMARTVYAITKEPRIVLNALKSTAQIGLMALHVLERVFKEKFELGPVFS